MNALPRFLILIGAVAQLPAKEPQPPGSPPPDFVIRSTIVTETDVVQAPPMQGLPPVSGTITTTVHLVEDPGIPDPVPVPPGPVLSKPSNLTELLKARTNAIPDHPVFLSASVNPDGKTLIRIHLMAPNRKEVAAWSNVDFNHFRGLSHIMSTDGSALPVRHSLMMGIGESANPSAPLPPSSLPALADGPAFVILSEEPADEDTVRIIEAMHELYRTDGPRLVAEYQARVLEEESRREYLLANPPQPKDVTIHFWQRKHPVGTLPETMNNTEDN